MQVTRTTRLVAAATLLASTGLAQGSDCGSADAVSGGGVHAFDLTGRTPAGPVGGGTCTVDTGSSYGDVFWQWTCTAAGDYRFDVTAPNVTNLAVYEGAGCSALLRTTTSGYTYSAFVPDRQPGDQLLLQLSQHVNSPDAIGTLTVASFDDGCSIAIDDVYEDNDRYDEALPFVAGSYPGLFAWRGDEDWFRIAVPADETIRVDWQSGGFAVVLRVLDAGCGQLGYAPGGTWDWTNRTGATVELVLNFRMRQGYDCASYDLDVAVAPAPCLVGTDDALEPNDACAAPAPITVGSYASLVTRDTDQDHYSIVLQPGERLDVIGDSNAILVAMFDAGCTLVSEAPRLNDYTNTGLAPETVVFRVRPDRFYSDGCAIYDIAVGTTPDFCATQADDALEDNDTPQTARAIGDGIYFDLWVSIYDPDFYSACVAPGDTFQAEIVFPDNVVALDLALSNAPGVQYDYFVDRVRAVYTNQSASAVAIGVHVSVLPILSDCWSYDMDISGTSRCRVGATPRSGRRQRSGQY